MIVYLVTQHYGMMSTSTDNVYDTEEKANIRADRLRAEYMSAHGEDSMLYFVMVHRMEVL